MENKTGVDSLEAKLRALLDQRRKNARIRNLTLPTPGFIDFSSNDFLSLSSNADLKSGYLSELQSSALPLGSGGSRLLDGNSPYAEALEREIAEFHGAETGLLFNSGFDANTGFFSCVPQPGDAIVYDELVHASVHDGMRLSRAAQMLSFRHNSVMDLRRVLEDVCLLKDGNNVFVAVESIYSMDGDVAPLREIVDVVEDVLGKDASHIIVDEAHSTGVLGPQGRGLVCELNLERRIFARLHTFGKALASNGGKHAPFSFVIDEADQVKSDSTWLSHSSPLSHKLRSTTHLHNIPFLPISVPRAISISASSFGNDCASAGTSPPFDTVPVHIPSSTAQDIICSSKYVGYSKCLSPISHFCDSFRAAKTTRWIPSEKGHDGPSCCGAHGSTRNGESSCLSACRQYG
jgi:hypothetical protein